MYRREGGVPNRAELRSPTESPPDWDLQNLFNLDFTSSFPAPCLKESLVQTPMKMQPNKIVQTTSAIGSPAWMEEEIKPFNSVLETLRELGLPDGISLENFTSDRGLNTPPPLPELSDLNDCITPEGKLEYLGFGESFVEKEDRREYSPINDTSSPLLDPNIENTVNLRDLFPLQNLGTESVGILNTQSSYLFEDSKQTLENQKPDYNHQQVIYEEPYKPVTTEQFDEGETSFVYLPSVCLEEPIEEQIIEVKPSVYEPITFESDDSSAEIITISVEEFNRLAGDLDLIQEANLIQEPGRSLIGTLPVSQAKALPIEPVYQLKTSQSSVPVVKQQADKRQSARTSGSEDDRKSSSSGSGSKKRRIASLDKDSEEYRDKRARNNESVRKSRDKAKHRQEETETRLDILSSENRRLQDKVDSLEKELSILRGLFSSSSTSNTIV